jgi:hypothetical protein
MPITKEDLEKYGLALCLIKMAMTPEQFDTWYAEELARRQERTACQKEKNG